MASLSFEYQVLKWGYNKNNGPEKWAVSYPAAIEGKRQSPVDISSVDVEEGVGAVCVKTIPCPLLNLENTGVSWQLHFHDPTVATLSGGALDNVYQVDAGAMICNVYLGRLFKSMPTGGVVRGEEVSIGLMGFPTTLRSTSSTTIPSTAAQGRPSIRRMDWRFLGCWSRSVKKSILSSRRSVRSCQKWKTPLTKPSWRQQWMWLRFFPRTRVG